MIERPMVNPCRFTATVSAVRALEATLIVLEALAIPYEYIDSKEWQRELLPKGLWKAKLTKTGRTVQKAESADLKFASIEVAKRLFPNAPTLKVGDADGMLIAEYARRKYSEGSLNK